MAGTWNGPYWRLSVQYARPVEYWIAVTTISKWRLFFRLRLERIQFQRAIDSLYSKWQLRETEKSTLFSSDVARFIFPVNGKYIQFTVSCALNLIKLIELLQHSRRNKWIEILIRVNTQRMDFVVIFRCGHRIDLDVLRASDFHFIIIY